MESIGLSKTIFNSSVCRLRDYSNVEIFLTERITREKASGAWPRTAIQWMLDGMDFHDGEVLMAENRDLDEPLVNEKILNSRIPFAEFLEKNRLRSFSRLTNPQLEFITHHLAHAYSASYMSPFEKSLILVIDGAGSRKKTFSSTHPEYALTQNQEEESAEERTLYTFDRGQLKCVDKKWQKFRRSEIVPGHYFSEGLGSFYEKVAEYIFNSKRAAGKVMGLAPYGKITTLIQNPQEYLESLDWSLAFQGKSKAEWEKQLPYSPFADVAANMQAYFEENLIDYLKQARARYPDYKNLILVGGCALNCTTNMKLFAKALFDQIYVPPFPSDEGISLGVAYAKYYQATQVWKPFPYELQTPAFGPKTSQTTEEEIRHEFSGFHIEKPASITEYCSKLLVEGVVIAWFQGRSESGPRSLGHRSLLMRPDRHGAKHYLNAQIKFRENFRPYGSSVLFEKASEYFEVPRGFENPFMSFAVKTRFEYLEALKEVTHVDGTSRMQTVRSTQNPRFYELLKCFGDKSGIYCLLNTSLNIMGEPIVETLKDARKFLENTPVHGLAIGDLYIKKVNV